MTGVTENISLSEQDLQDASSVSAIYFKIKCYDRLQI
jgi:hypothetical protein